MLRPPPATSREAARMRPANSGLSASMPVSTMAMVCPTPVCPACQAVIAPCWPGPSDRRYSAVSKFVGGGGVGVGVGTGAGVGTGVGAGGGVEIGPPPPPPPQPASSKVNAQAAPASHGERRLVPTRRGSLPVIATPYPRIAGLVVNTASLGLPA